MLKKYIRERTKYEQYFMEAPGDENKVSVSVAPRINRGTDYSQEPEEESQGASASVTPRANRGTDYSKEDDTDTTENNADTTDDGDSPTDYSQEDDSQANTPDEENQDATEDESDTGAEDDDGDDDQPTDYSQEDDTGGDGGEDASSTEDSGSSEDQIPDEEKAQKYAIYKEFLYLYDTLQTMEDRLRRLNKDDAAHNAVINTVCSNFSDLRDKIQSFLLVKFRSSSYIQIQTFYKTAMAIVKLNIELIKNNSIKLKQ